MESLVVPDVKKIAVLRSLVLGDLIFSLPALDALHRTYPNAEIHYLGRPWHAEYIPGRIPGVTQVHPFLPAKQDYADLGFLIDPDEAGPFFEKMQAESFDIAIQMQGGGFNSNRFIRYLKPRLSVGSREPGAPDLDRWQPHHFHQNEIIRQLDLVSLVGAKTPHFNPRLSVLDSDRAAVAPFLKKIDRPFVVLHSGARDIRRCWPPEKFAALGDCIKQKLGLEVVLTGTNEVYDDTANVIEDLMESRPINLSGQLSLSGLTGLLASAELVVSNDTGPMHLALAVGTKTIGLFWSEYIIKSLPLTRTNFHPLIAWDKHCPLCGTFLTHFEVVSCDPRPCMHEISFIENIQVNEVYHTAEGMLSH